MLTKFKYITNLNKLLQVGILTFYRAFVSSPFNRSPWLAQLADRVVQKVRSPPDRKYNSTA
jgi:hypothetical protein